MERIDAVEVLAQLYPVHPRSMGSKILKRRVDVAREEARTDQEWATLLADLKGAGLITTRKDSTFGELVVVITDAGINVFKESGA